MFYVALAEASVVDARMQVELLQQESLTIKSAAQLALPTLWKRVVPTGDLEKANALDVRVNLVLRFQPLKHGARVIFNPAQVRAYLKKKNITMIPKAPHWNLEVNVIGFAGEGGEVAADLMDYSQDIAAELGFKVSPRGRRLQLVFSPIQDAYGESMIHLNVQGGVSADLLSQTDVLAEGYLSYQLQAWLQQILREIRDAYSLGKMDFKEKSSQTLLTIEAAHSLSTQVMLEQALRSYPAVLSLAPVLLQKARRQYHVQLRDGDDGWMISWFAGYGLTATKQPEDAFTDWLID